MASRTNPNSWPGPAYGGPCDQFGAYCRMWEVVDFAELEPGKQASLVAIQVMTLMR
jgi:hypothetical protein